MKHTKTIFITVIAVLFTVAGFGESETYAQNINLGIKGGFSVPQLSSGGNEISSGYKSRFDAAFGIYINDYFSSNFALQMEVLYVGQGGKRKGMQPIPEENLTGMPVPAGMQLFANFENEAILDYLEIPLLAKYTFHLSNSFGFYIDVGPYVGFLLKAKTKTSGESGIFLDKDGKIQLRGPNGELIPAMDFNHEEDITNDIETINFGLTGGVGIEFIMDSSSLTLDVRGSGGLTHIQKDITNGNNKTGALVVTAGYSINL